MKTFVLPTDEKLRREYRLNRIKNIWMARSSAGPAVYIFKGDSYDEKIPVVTIDETAKEMTLVGNKLSVPPPELLTNNHFAAISKMFVTISFPEILLQNEAFFALLMENRCRFWKIVVLVEPDTVEDQVSQKKMQDLTTGVKWTFKPEYKAGHEDIKREFKYRLREFYPEVFANGAGLVLGVVTAPIGIFLLVAGCTLLPIDAAYSGISYLVLKNRK